MGMTKNPLAGPKAQAGDNFPQHDLTGLETIRTYEFCTNIRTVAGPLVRNFVSRS